MDKTVVVKDSVCKLAEGDHITFEIDTADGLESVNNAISTSELAIKQEIGKITAIDSDITEGKKKLSESIVQKGVYSTENDSLIAMAECVRRIQTAGFDLTGLKFTDGHQPTTAIEVMTFKNNYLEEFVSEEITELSSSSLENCKVLKKIEVVNCISIASDALKNLPKLEKLVAKRASAFKLSYLNSINSSVLKYIDFRQVTSFLEENRSSRLILSTVIEEVNWENLEVVPSSAAGIFSSNSRLKKLHLPRARTQYTTSYTLETSLVQNCPLLTEVVTPLYTTVINGKILWRTFNLLRRVVIGENAMAVQPFNDSLSTPLLIKIELYGIVGKSIKLSMWNPTTALSSSDDFTDIIDLREDSVDYNGVAITNNRQQFLHNFKTHIADHLAVCTDTSTLTLTLAQAVRDILTDDIEEIIVNQKHWVIAPAKSI